MRWAGLAEVIPLMTIHWNTEKKNLRSGPPSYGPGFSVELFQKHEVILPTLAHDFPPKGQYESYKGKWTLLWFRAPFFSRIRGETCQQMENHQF